MSSEISQNIVNITKDGVLKIVISLGTQDWLTKLSGFKKKINKKTARFYAEGRLGRLSCKVCSKMDLDRCQQKNYKI